MISADQVIFKRGDVTIFDGLSFAVHAGQKVGVVGRNGVGKSTLFELLTGRLDTDAGDLALPPQWRISHMRQEVAANDRPAIEFVLDGHEALRRTERRLKKAEASNSVSGEELATLHAQYDDLGGHQANAQATSILRGLGFPADVHQQPFASFSGGWRIRLALAQTLMRPADLLLLDEPTNHLDFETTVWLEHYLARFEGTLLVIAHDRTFLDNVCTQTLHLTRGRGRVYRGGYSAFERARAEALELEAKQRAKQQKQRDHIEQFVARFRAKASKAKQVQSRLKALERMAEVATVHADSPYRVAFTNPKKVSNPVMGFRDIDLGYDQNLVLSGISQSILPGARIGVLGVNGAGKSTLLKCLVGDLAPLRGAVDRGQHSTVGYFSQHQLETLDAHHSALHHVSQKHADMTQQAARDLLGGWGFDGNMVERAVTTLSGGRESATGACADCDIRTGLPGVGRTDQPPGPRHARCTGSGTAGLRRRRGDGVTRSPPSGCRPCDELWLVKDGRLQRFDASLESYSTALTEAKQKTAVEKTDSRKARRREAAEQRAQSAAAKRHLKQVESTLHEKTEALKQLESQLADGEAYRTMPAEELDALLRQAGRLRESVEQLETDWLNAAEKLERESQS